MAKLCLIFLLLWSLTEAELPDRYNIETFLSSSTSDLISKEAHLTKKLDFFQSLVSICSSNLKASNISSNLTEVLDNYVLAINESRLMKNYNLTQLNLVNLTSYSYAQFRISTLFSDVKKLRVILDILRENSVKFYKMSRNLSTQYLVSYKTIVKITSKNKLVNTVIRHIFVYFNELSSYLKLLNTQISNYQRMNNYLSNLIRSKAISVPFNVTPDPFIEKLRSIESKLIVGQYHVISTSKVALKKIASSERSVESRKVQSTTADFFKVIKDVLNECAKSNEYSLLGWPQLPDLSDSDDEQEMLTTVDIRAKVAEGKEKSYGYTKKSSENQKSAISNARQAFYSKSVQSGVKKVQALPADVLTAILNVENMLTLYVGRLENATKAVMDMKENSQKPCGSFVPYDTFNDINGPAVSGFLGGINFEDGKTNTYVGYGNVSSNCYSQFACPCFIITNSSAPGCYAACDKLAYSKNQVFFLLAHPKLTWVPTDSTAMMNLPGVLKIIGDPNNFPFFFGRIKYNGFNTLGKVHAVSGNTFCYQIGPTARSTCITSGFEVLTCRP